MKRRTFVAVCGAGLLAGCLGDETSSGDGRATGTPSESPTTGPSGASPTTNDPTTGGDSTGTVDPASFETIENDGVDVGLIPVDDAYTWHREGLARFVDARGEKQYEKSHIDGAVNSPARMDPEPGPTADWETDATVVTYCGCPHHLSSMRASQLKQRGFERVYAIDEGFWEWKELGYPVVGTDVTTTPESVAVSGTLDTSLAGEEVWAVHEPTAQREVTSVEDDGSYTMHLRFYGVDADSTIRLTTPGGSRDVSLGELSDAL